MNRLKLRGFREASGFMNEVISTVGVTGAIFIAFMTVNALLAFSSADWRLRRVALLFAALWLVTHFFPYTEIIASPVSFVILTRLQIRRPGEARLSWWMVPVIAAEAGLFLSHIAYFAVDYMTYWVLVQLFFVIQLLVAIIAGARLTFCRWRGRADRPAHGFAYSLARK